MEDDIIIKGLLFDKSVVLTAISGRVLTSEAVSLHSLSRVCTAALGRTLLQVAMMASQLKNDTDSITVTIRGGGPAGSIVAVGHRGGIVKGYVSNPAIELPLNDRNKLDVSGAVGCDGDIQVVRDLSMKEPYIGSSRLVDGEIADDFANYFLMSEQQPALVYLGVRIEPPTGNVRSAAGLMLQPLPGCPEEHIAALERLSARITGLSEALDEGRELEDLLKELFADADLDITQRLTPRYSCDCSRERLERVLVSLGESELKDIIETDHCAEVTCRFCDTKYRFNEAELRGLLYKSLEKQEDTNR